MKKHYFERKELESLLKSIKGKTLGEVDKKKVFSRTKKNPKITGIAGDVIEQSVLNYPPDTRQEPDLNVSGTPIELKTTGIKINKKSDNRYEAKEPLTITAVSPDKIVKEKFKSSLFWHKVEHILFVYYLYNSDKTVKAADYAKFPILDYQFHEFDSEEIKVLMHDWQVVRDFIKKVKDLKLDKNIEYPKISKLRDRCLMLDTAPKYPHNPRFRLKRSVVTNIFQKRDGKTPLEELEKEYISFADIDKECHDLTKHFSGQSIEEIAKELNIKDNLKNKAVCEKITIKMFGGQSTSFSKVDIFNKYGIIGKTIVLTKKGAPTEQMKLFKIDFEELINDSIKFEESSFRDYFAERQFLFIVLEEPYSGCSLKDNIFKGFKRVSFSDDFIENSVLPVWKKMRKLIKKKELKDIVEYDENNEPKKNKTGVVVSAPNFPKQKDGEVFVRGSGVDSNSKTITINNIKMYPQYIWIKGKYIAAELDKKDYL